MRRKTASDRKTVEKGLGRGRSGEGRVRVRCSLLHTGEGVFLGGESTEEQERAKVTAPQAVSEDLLCAVAQAQSWSRGSFILPKGRQGGCARGGGGGCGGGPLGAQLCAVRGGVERHSP